MMLNKIFLSSLMEQIFLVGEGGIQNLPNYFITIVIIFQL